MNKMSLALIGLGAVAFAGCSQDEQFLAKQNGDYTAVIEKGVESRSYSNINGAFKWAAGDDIAAWVTNNGSALGFKTMKMVGGAGTDKASYGAVVGGKPTDVAVFPVGAAKSYDGGVLTVNYPSVYDNYCTDYNKDSMSVSDPMAAFFAQGEKQFVFRHVGGVIEWDIDVPAYIDEFTVKMNSGVTGDFTVDATDKSNPYASARENTVDSVSFKFGLTTESKEIHFYMPVPVGTYKGCTIYIKNNGKVVDSFTSEAENTVRRCDWIVMPLISMGYTGVIENAVTAWAGLRQVAENGGVVSLGSDIVVKEDTNVVVGAGKSLVVDLNGKRIESAVDLWNDNRRQWSLFSAQGGTLVLKGDGMVKAKENGEDCFAVDVRNNGHLVIEGGHYVGNCDAVYVFSGTAEIKGGVFELQKTSGTPGKDYEYMLNCYDANYKNGTAKIIVTGGTFIGFNPADCQAEGAHTNFLAPGYVSVRTTYEGRDAWTVKKIEATPVTNAELKNAFKVAGNVIAVNGNLEINEYTTLNKEVVLSIAKDAEIKANSDRSMAIKVIRNGVLDVYGQGKITGTDNSTATFGSTALMVENGTLNIWDNVTVEGGKGASVNSAVWLNNGTVNIYNGSFHVGLDKNGNPNPCIYVSSSDSKTKATANIYGGVFEADNPQYLLNINDNDRGVCAIKVYGGTFVGFNPADNASEGEHTNFVAEGYKSEKTTYNGKEAWKVVKE